MERAVMFKFGGKAAIGGPPPNPDEPHPSSLAYYIARYFQASATIASDLPNGYGRLLCPKKGVVDRELSVRVVLPPSPIDRADKVQRDWWQALPTQDRDRFKVDVKIETTKAFDVSQNSHTIHTTAAKRVVAAEFLLRPTVSGTHSVKLSLSYSGADDPFEYSWRIKVKSKWTDTVQRVGLLMGLIVAAIAIWRFVRGS